MTRFTRRFAFFATGLVSLALICFYFYPRSAVVPSVVTVPVRIGSIQKTVLASGKVDSSARVSVGTQVSGQVKALLVHPGQTIKKGQLIAEIDDQPQRSELRGAVSRLNQLISERRSNVANLKLATEKRQREKNLLEGEAASEEDYESAEASFSGAQAQLSASDAQIVQARIEVQRKKLELGYTRIVSPMKGVVIAISTQKGQTVNASQNTPTIAVLARLDKMIVRVKISEADITHIHPGLPASFTVFSDPGRHYKAKLLNVSLAPDSVSAGEQADSSNNAVYYSAILEVPNPDNTLRIDMTAQVSVVLAQASNVLLVPVMAVQTDGGHSSVQVKEPDGQLVTRSIKTGLSDGSDIQVISGLKVGEQVVLATPPQIAEGSNDGEPW